MRLDYETRESAQRKKETSIGRGVPVDGISEVLVGHGLGTNWSGGSEGCGLGWHMLKKLQKPQAIAPEIVHLDPKKLLWMFISQH